jgi:hypothetical protein
MNIHGKYSSTELNSNHTADALDMNFTKKRQIRMYKKFMIDGFQEKKNQYKYIAISDEQLLMKFNGMQKFSQKWNMPCVSNEQTYNTVHAILSRSDGEISITSALDPSGFSDTT